MCFALVKPAAPACCSAQATQPPSGSMPSMRRWQACSTWLARWTGFDITSASAWRVPSSVQMSSGTHSDRSSSWSRSRSAGACWAVARVVLRKPRACLACWRWLSPVFTTSHVSEAASKDAILLRLLQSRGEGRGVKECVWPVPVCCFAVLH